VQGKHDVKIVLWTGFLLSLVYALYAGISAFSAGFLPFREAEATVFYLLVLMLPLLFGAVILRRRSR
jgi:hypothetical protein